MSKYSNTIEYQLKTSADLKGIEQLQKSLTQVTTTLNRMHWNPGVDHLGLDQSLANVQKLQDALTKAFNPKLGIINGQQLQKEIGNIGLDTLINDLNKAGASGQIAINNMVGGLGRIHTNLNTISSAVDKVVNTFGNTVRWGITASIFETMSNNLRRSVEYVQDLDTSLNNIQIVSGQSNEQMKSFAEWASKAGQDLGRSTIDIVDAAQIFAQNGFNIEDQKKLAELTNEVANVTQQSSETASSQITSLMNGYKLSIDEAKDALDAMALVAAESASDLNELATAETRVASLAHDLGVSQNQLTAQLSTMVSVTRQAPETVGNALRSIYARIGDLKLGETLEDGVNLGKVSGALQSVGINVLDANGQMREMGEILEDLMDKWDELDRAQQQALAIQVAGKQQVNMFQTLMSNADMYRDTLETAEGAIGTLDKQQEIYMNSAVAKMQSLSAAGEGLINSLFNADNYKPAIDTLTTFVNILQNVVDSVGGGLPILTAFTSMFLKLGNREIGTAIGDFVFNKKQNKAGEDSDAYNTWLLSSLGGTRADTTAAYKFTQEQYGGKRVTEMNAADQQEYNRILEETVETEKASVAAAYNYNEALKERIKQEEKEHALIEQGIKLYVDENHQIKAIADEASEGIIDTSYIDDLESSFLSLEEIESVLEEDTAISKKWKDAIVKVAQELKNAKDILGTEYDYEVFTNTKVEELRKIAQEQQDEIDQRQGLIWNYNSGEYQPAETPEVAKARQEYEVQRTNVAYKEQEQKDFIDSQKIKEQVRSIMELTEGVTSLFFALQSLKSIGEIISDDSISNTEKFDKIVGNLVITVPSLIDGFSKLSKVTEGLNGLVSILGNSGIVIKLAETIPIFTGLTGAAEAATAGTLGFGEAIGALALPIGVAVAAIWALITAIKIVYDWVHRYDIALEKANENLKIAQENTNRAQTALSELKSGLEQIKNSDDAFDELKEGTIEWTQALLEANEQVLNLLDKYPELAQYVTTGEHGQLTIDEEGYQTIIDNQMRELAQNQAAQAADIRAQSIAENAKLVHDTNITVQGGYSGYAYGTGTSTAVILTDEQKRSIATYLATENGNATGQELVDQGLISNLDSANKILAAHRETLIDLGTKLEQNTLAAQSSSDAYIQAALSQNESYQALTANEKDFVNQLTVKDFNKDSEVYQKVAEQIQSYSEQQLQDMYREMADLDKDANLPDMEDIKDAIIAAGVIDELNQNKELLTARIEEAQNLSSVLTSILGESGAEAFNFKNKSFNFEGINFTDYVEFKGDEFQEKIEEEISKNNIFEKLGFNSSQEFMQAWKEGIREVSLETIDMRLNGNLEDQIYDLQDKMSDALEKIRTDAELTGDDYKIFLEESLQNSLDAVKISSDSVGSVYELLIENGIDAEKTIYAINDALNEQQHALQVADIQYLSNQYEELRENSDNTLKKLKEIDESNISIHLNDDEVLKAHEDLLSLYDIAEELENQSFSLGIDVGADLLDQSNAIIDVLDDIVTATSAVGDEFLVAADDIDALAAAFPGILEGYSVTAEGMIQLNASVVQSILGVTSTDAESVAEAQRSKLKTYADYAGAMAEMYEKEAEEMRKKAEEEVATNAEAKRIIAETDQKLSDAQADELERRGIVFDSYSNQQEATSDDINKNMAEQFASSTESASKNIETLGKNSLTVFQKMANAATKVAEAIEAMGRGDVSKAQAAQSALNDINNAQQDLTSTGGSSYQSKTSKSDREQLQWEMRDIRRKNRETIAANRQALQEDIASGSKLFSDTAKEYEAKAQAYRIMQSKLLASAAKIQAKGIESSSQLDNVGIPEPEKEKKEKEKNLKDYIENPEAVTGSNIDMKEYLDDEADRYERINTILEKLANQFTRIANEQDRITGHDYAKNLGEQIALLKTQIQAQEKKLALQKEEAEQLKTNLAGQGVAFDSAGFALNNTEVFNSLQSKYNSAVDAYNEAQIQAQNNYLTEINRVKQENNQRINSLIDQYNNTAAGSEEESALKSEVERAQKAATSSEKAVENAYKNLQSSNKEYYENLLKNSKETLDQYQENIQRYDQLVSEEIEQSETTIEEFYNKIEDLQIEAYKKTVSMISNLKDMRETVLDINTLFSKLVSGDRPLDRMNNAVAKLSNYWDAGTESMLEYYSKEANEAAKRAQDMSLTQSERDYYARRVGDIESIMDSIRTNDSMETGNKGWFQLQIEDMNKLLGQIDQFESTGESSIFGKNSAQLYEAVKNSLDGAKKYLEAYVQEYEELQNAFSDYLDEIYNKTDRQLTKFDHLNEKLEHYQKLIEMTYGNSRNYESLMVLYDNMIENNENQIAAIQQVISNYKAMQEELNTETADGLQKWYELQDKILDKEKALWSQTEQQIETINKKFELQNEQAIEDWERSLLNGQTISEYADQWEIISRNAEQYLDAVESAYEVQKLQNKYTNLLNSTNTLTTQQRIRDAMTNQLELLQGETQLSQYQVDYANAQFEILQKTIALEEARNNKNNMRLQRDRQGNYSYVYTANDNDTNSAAADLLDAQQNAYEISKNALISSQENIISVLQSTRNAILEIMNDTTLTEEQKEEKIKVMTEAMEQYLERETKVFELAQGNILQDALNVASSITVNTTDTFNNIMKDFAEGNDETLSEIDERFTNSVLSWINDGTTVQAANDELIEHATQNFAEWQSSVENTAGDVVNSLGEVTSAISETTEETMRLKDETDAFIESLNNDLGVVAQYTQHINELGGQIGSMRDTLSIYAQKAAQLENKLAVSESRNYNMEQEVAQQASNAQRAATINTDIINATSGSSSYSAAITSTGSVNGYNSIFTTSASSGDGDSTIRGYSFDDLVEGIAGNIWTYDSWGDDPTRHAYMIEKFGQETGDAIYNAVQSLFSSGYGYNYDPHRWASGGYAAYSEFDVSRFDTGGYTGDWNNQDNGRLAILHEKELVLNPQDTINILQAVDLIRQMISNISSSSLGSHIQNINSSTEMQELTQNIQIEANFPNATSENDIREAILSLTNNVAQYAHRKK